MCPRITLREGDRPSTSNLRPLSGRGIRSGCDRDNPGDTLKYTLNLAIRLSIPLISSNSGQRSHKYTLEALASQPETVFSETVDRSMTAVSETVFSASGSVLRFRFFAERRLRILCLLAVLWQ